jgi:hypothetical protein
MPTLSGTKSEHLEDITARRSRLLAGRVLEQPTLMTNRVIAMLKLLLPAIAIAIIGLTFAWSQLMPEKGKFRLGEASIANVGVQGVIMGLTARITRTKFQLHKQSKRTKPTS